MVDRSIEQYILDQIGIVPEQIEVLDTLRSLDKISNLRVVDFQQYQTGSRLHVSADILWNTQDPVFSYIGNHLGMAPMVLSDETHPGGFDETGRVYYSFALSEGDIELHLQKAEPKIRVQKITLPEGKTVGECLGISPEDR